MAVQAAACHRPEHAVSGYRLSDAVQAAVDEQMAVTAGSDRQLVPKRPSGVSQYHAEQVNRATTTRVEEQAELAMMLPPAAELPMNGMSCGGQFANWGAAVAIDNVWRKRSQLSAGFPPVPAACWLTVLAGPPETMRRLEPARVPSRKPTAGVASPGKRSKAGGVMRFAAAGVRWRGLRRAQVTVRNARRRVCPGLGGEATGSGGQEVAGRSRPTGGEAGRPVDLGKATKPSTLATN